MHVVLIWPSAEVNAKDIVSEGALWELVRIARDCSREDIRMLAYRTLTSSPTLQSEMRRLRIECWWINQKMQLGLTLGGVTFLVQVEVLFCLYWYYPVFASVHWRARHTYLSQPARLGFAPLLSPGSIFVKLKGSWNSWWPFIYSKASMRQVYSSVVCKIIIVVKSTKATRSVVQYGESERLQVAR
jgi:hypothetical protein